MYSVDLAFEIIRIFLECLLECTTKLTYDDRDFILYTNRCRCFVRMV